MSLKQIWTQPPLFLVLSRAAPSVMLHLELLLGAGWTEHADAHGCQHKEKGVCLINNLTAPPLTLTERISQNNSSFCWGQLQDDLIVVSGKRLSQHPILFFIITTKFFCQLLRSKSLNCSCAKKLYFPWKNNIIGHHSVELPLFTGTLWRNRKKILRRRF